MCRRWSGGVPEVGLLSNFRCAQDNAAEEVREAAPPPEAEGWAEGSPARRAQRAGAAPVDYAAVAAEKAARQVRIIYGEL